MTGVSGGNTKEKAAMGKPVFTREGALQAKERQGGKLCGQNILGTFEREKKTLMK